MHVTIHRRSKRPGNFSETSGESVFAFCWLLGMAISPWPSSAHSFIPLISASVITRHPPNKNFLKLIKSIYKKQSTDNIILNDERMNVLPKNQDLDTGGPNEYNKARTRDAVCRWKRKKYNMNKHLENPKKCPKTY